MTIIFSMMIFILIMTVSFFISETQWPKFLKAFLYVMLTMSISAVSVFALNFIAPKTVERSIYDIKKIVTLPTEKELFVISEDKKNSVFSFTLVDIEHQTIIHEQQLHIPMKSSTLQYFPLTEDIAYITIRDFKMSDDEYTVNDHSYVYQIEFPTFRTGEDVYPVVEDAETVRRSIVPGVVEDTSMMYIKENKVFQLSNLDRFPVSETAVSLPQTGGKFLDAGTKDIVYEVDESFYMLCPDGSSFEKDRLECSEAINKPWHITDTGIAKLDKRTQKYEDIKNSFILYPLKNALSITELYQSDELLVFITHGNVDEPSFLTYVSRETRWQRELPRSETFNYIYRDYSYENEMLCETTHYTNKESTKNDYQIICQDIQSEAEQLNISTKEFANLWNKLN